MIESNLILSADTHIVEPPDLYKNRMATKYKDRAPQIKRLRDDNAREFDAWFVDGKQVVTLGSITQAGKRYKDPSSIDFLTLWEDVRPGAYQPEEFIKDLEIDGIWGSIVQPSQGLFWYHIKDSNILTDICQAYNTWIADFCSGHLNRLRGIGMLNVDDIEVACKELIHCAELGLAGVYIPVTPLEGRPYRSPIYEKLWATAQDYNMPLIMHFATQRFNVPGCDLSIDFKTFTPEGMRPTQDFWVRYSLCGMIFAGVFERYPHLRVGSVEHEASWIPHWLKQMDFTYIERPVYRGFQSKEGMLPSEYWHRNMFACFQEDEIALRLIDIIGVHNLLWGNDYPHSESSWPKSQELLKAMFAHTSRDDFRKITQENAISIFKFSLPSERLK